MPDQFPITPPPGFTLGALIAENSLSIVHHALRNHDQLPVICRHLAPSLTNRQDLTEAFLNTQQHCAQLQNPHLLTPLMSGCDGSHVFVILPKLTRINATAYVAAQRASISHRQILELVSDAARGLMHLHQAGLIHHQVHPTNIFCSPDGRGQLSEPGPYVPSPAEIPLTHVLFRAPETLRSMQPGDVRSDIYALGMTLWVLLTGESPFRCDSLPHVIEQILDQPIPDPRGIDLSIRHDLANLVLTATAQDPDLRYQSASEFLLAAEAVFDASRLSRIRPALPQSLHPSEMYDPTLDSSKMFDDSKIGRPIPLSSLEPPPIPTKVQINPFVYRPPRKKNWLDHTKQVLYLIASLLCIGGAGYLVWLGITRSSLLNH